MCAGPPVETTYWKANANDAQPVHETFFATARLCGVTVCGLPVISTAWNATAIAWQPLQSCAVARATFAEVSSSVPVGPAIMLERATVAYIAAPTIAQRRPAKRTASVASRMPMSARIAHHTPTIPHPNASAATASGTNTAADATIAPAR